MIIKELGVDEFRVRFELARAEPIEAAAIEARAVVVQVCALDGSREVSFAEFTILHADFIVGL